MFFIEFKRDPSASRPQDDKERLNDKHQRKGSLVCHSAAGEKSHAFSFRIKKSKMRSFGLRPQGDTKR